jgi:predicted 3-demethylubiquinone-9 3-methyltransferase (glyoxalase superfamily)
MITGSVYGKAEEAMKTYVGLFEKSSYGATTRNGEHLLTATFMLDGARFMVQNSDAPHEFGFTPASSILCEFDDEASLRRVYDGLVDGGEILMELADYPFSKLFAFIKDRYGVSWQLML